MHLLYPLAKRFIAGEDRQTALRSIDALTRSGYSSTIDVLGEHVHSEDQTHRARDEYLNLVHEVDPSTALDFSIKLSQMGLDLSESLCKENLGQILNAAGRHTARLDMEGSPYTQRTVDICLEMNKAGHKLGIALQAYLHRTEMDCPIMLDQGISVRLCKGAYKEKPDIAYQSMGDIRANFRKLAFRMLKEGVDPAIATHDEYLIQEVISFVKKEHIDPKSFYFELLYGVRRDLHKTLLKNGYQVRIYVPYGKSWLPYTLRRLAERKENVLFVVKNVFMETFGLGRKLN